jgi:site-specific recombinase XerD
MVWVAKHPGNDGHFQPQQLTKTAVEMYLAYLEHEGYTINHRARVKSTISSFAQWLIEEKGLLQRNPTRGAYTGRFFGGKSGQVGKTNKTC